jgi:hypothetical protein
MLAQRQERGPLRLLGRRQALPFGAAHRTEEDGLARLAHLQGSRRQGLAMVVDGNAADIGAGIGKEKPNFCWTASSTLMASAITSGPMPSPARTASTRSFPVSGSLFSTISVSYQRHTFRKHATAAKFFLPFRSFHADNRNPGDETVGHRQEIGDIW